MTGGYMNMVYKCWAETEDEPLESEGAVVVRINGNITDSKLVDRPREIRNLRLLNSRGITKFLATYANGIVYTFVEGENLDRIVSEWKIIRYSLLVATLEKK